MENPGLKLPDWHFFQDLRLQVKEVKFQSFLRLIRGGQRPLNGKFVISPTFSYIDSLFSRPPLD